MTLQWHGQLSRRAAIPASYYNAQGEGDLGHLRYIKNSKMRAVKFHSTSLIQNGYFEHIRASAAKWPILIEGNRRHHEQATQYVVRHGGFRQRSMDASMTDICGSALGPWSLPSMLRARGPGGHPGPNSWGW